MSDHRAVDHLFDIAPFTTSWRLEERFGIPPFSTLDTRNDTWRRRRSHWLKLDMKSTVGRRERLTFVPAGTDAKPAEDEVSKKIMAVGTTSEFDPLLCEAAIRWWCPKDGVILDPFAGGSVRGIVAGVLGREYHGVDLSQEQVTADYATLERLRPIVDIEPEPEWHVGDSSTWQPDVRADLVFSCPPYGSLERYSQDERDLSNMKYRDFERNYRRSVILACERLRDDRFACFVVGNYREDGVLKNLVALTVDAFESCGLTYHADLVLLNSTASAGLRASAQFNVGRKPTMCHQHVVVMCKGDPRAAAAAAERLDPLDLTDADVLAGELDYDVEDGRR